MNCLVDILMLVHSRKNNSKQILKVRLHKLTRQEACNTELLLQE